MKKLFLIPLMACMMCVSMVAQNVAKIGETEYATINEAFEAAANGATIQMIADADFQQPIKLNVNEDESTHKAYTLDLNGKMLTFNPASTKNDYTQRTSIILYGGALNIINSVPGVGGITNNTSGESSTNVVMVHGTYKKTCNPKTEENINNLFTYLNVAEGVNFYTSGIGVTVDGLNGPIKDGNDTINKGTKIYKYDWINENGVWLAGATKSAAFGVRVDIRGSIEANKYGVKANGDLAFPDPEYRGGWTEAQLTEKGHPDSHGPRYYFTKGEDTNPKSSIRYKFYGNNTETISTEDAQYTPYIHIFPSAVLKAGNSKKNTAAYCSGYARWLIEGSCAAANGVYVRSGDVVLKDAVVESTYKDEATLGTTGSSGINGAGWAIIAESKNNYAGETSLTIQGDTKASTEAEGGAALKESIEANSENTNITAISIDGGTFTGDNSIMISETTASSTEADVTIYGTVLDGEITIGEEGSNIDDLLPENVHTTVVEDKSGKPTVIISEGAAPETPGLTPEEVLAGETNSWADIAAQSNKNNRKNVAWTGIDAEKGVGTIASNEEIYLGELQMISGTEENNQTLTINSGGELNVSQLILNKNARIIVKPGAKLIVVGEQGMHAPSSENIVLETSDAQPAYFMFHPNVTSNRHPLAKIQFHSRGYQKPIGEYDVEGGKYQWQRFGVPSWKPINIKTCIATLPAKTQFQRIVNDDPANYNLWEILSKDDDLVPFTSYAMTSQSTTEGIVYTFGCEIVGNGDVELKLYEHYNYYSNSYTAPIDIKKLLTDFKANYPHLQAVVYLNDPVSNWWYELNNTAYFFYDDLPTTIEPMQAFSFMRNSAGENPKINYNTEVWTPMIGSGSGAPARAQEQTFNSARIEITAADGTKDAVCLAESDDFTSEFDNSFDAEKFIYEGKTLLFANGCYDKMGIHATDNLEGTTFGLITNDQTSFMMTFDHVSGLNYAIRDMLTGTETEIVEGATYMFSVPENTTVENRFKIVAVNKVPTATENIEVENGEKGIYNMAGIYVGTDFHALPAGVYVVDGKKIVK